jgi:glycosyltransferase involved in cell wall biosynthesis
MPHQPVELQPMKVLIAICTYNRAHLLRETLECLETLVRPVDCTLGILIVNNCCKDDTDQVVARFKDKLPLMLVHENKPGLSNARNCAVREAKDWGADYIIWTDDDVRPYPEWLASYCSAFSRHPGTAVLGGPVEPWFEITPPGWISNNWQHLQYAFAVRDLGPQECELDPVKGLPFGANFSIRTDAQFRYPYDPKLGVSKGKRLAGEETVVMREILSSGESGWWLPEARVRHFIERERLNISYITKYFYGAGASASLVRTDASTRLFNRPRWMFKQFGIEVSRMLLSLLMLRTSSWVICYTNVLFALGQLSVPPEMPRSE